MMNMSLFSSLFLVCFLLSVCHGAVSPAPAVYAHFREYMETETNHLINGLPTHAAYLQPPVQPYDNVQGIDVNLAEMIRIYSKLFGCKASVTANQAVIPDHQKLIYALNIYTRSFRHLILLMIAMDTSIHNHPMLNDQNQFPSFLRDNDPERDGLIWMNRQLYARCIPHNFRTGFGSKFNSWIPNQPDHLLPMDILEFSCRWYFDTMCGDGPVSQNIAGLQVTTIREEFRISMGKNQFSSVINICLPVSSHPNLSNSHGPFISSSILKAFMNSRLPALDGQGTGIPNVPVGDHYLSQKNLELNIHRTNLN